jgi:hypothetical protein
MLNNSLKSKVRRISNLIFIFGMIFASYVTNIFNVGISLSDSAKYFPTLLLPEPYAFSIWGIIFPALIAYGMFQNSSLNYDNVLLKKIGVHTAIAFFLTTVWVANTQLYDLQDLDFIFAFIILYFLMSAFYTINSAYQSLSYSEYYFVYVPLSLFTGWMTIATLLTVSSALKYTAINNFGLSEQLVSISLLGVATIFVSIINRHSNGNFFYIAPIIWGLVGIAVASTFAHSNPGIAKAASVCAVVLFYMLINEQSKIKHKNIFRR